MLTTRARRNRRRLVLLKRGVKMSLSREWLFSVCYLHMLYLQEDSLLKWSNFVIFVGANKNCYCIWFYISRMLFFLVISIYCKAMWTLMSACSCLVIGEIFCIANEIVFYLLSGSYLTYFVNHILFLSIYISHRYLIYIKGGAIFQHSFIGMILFSVDL